MFENATIFAVVAGRDRGVRHGAMRISRPIWRCAAEDRARNHRCAL